MLEPAAYNTGFSSFDYKTEGYLDGLKPADLNDVVQHLNADELDLMYSELNIKYNEVEKAKQAVPSTDVNRREKAVLRHWMQRNGKKATRFKILKALEGCGLLHSKEELEEEWKQKYQRGN